MARTKGSVGTNTGTIIKVRNGRKVRNKGPRHSNCKRCIHAVVKSEIADCMITGEIAVNRKYCEFYKSADAFKKKHKKSNDD